MKILVLLSILCSAMAFAPIASQTVSASRRATLLRAMPTQDDDTITGLLRQSKSAVVAAAIAFLPVGAAMAAEEIEIAELPPPYVPAIFGVVLLAGVGLLTSSLGNVYDEESSLGMQSGARAKKERDRSRSSYFRK